jgi:hypothetical protein
VELRDIEIFLTLAEEPRFGWPGTQNQSWAGEPLVPELTVGGDRQAVDRPITRARSTRSSCARLQEQ